MATTEQLFYQVTGLPFADALATGREANSACGPSAKVRPLSTCDPRPSRVLAAPVRFDDPRRLGAAVIRSNSRAARRRAFGRSSSGTALRARVLLRRQPQQAVDHREPARPTDDGDPRSPKARSASRELSGQDACPPRARRSGRTANEKLVVSCTGFGQTGPRTAQGLRHGFQAMGGIMSLTGRRGGGPVNRGAGGRSRFGPLGRNLDSHLRWPGAPRREGQLRGFLDDRRPGGAAHAGSGAVFRARRSAAATRHERAAYHPSFAAPTAAGSHHGERSALAEPVPRARARGVGAAGARSQLGPRAPARR